jgi:uncharacterized protein (TIGR03546 family)
MFILIYIRKIYKALSADASPSAIAFAVLFGLTLGFVPIFKSGLGLLLLCSLLVFRVQVSTALLALGLGKLIALAGAARYFVPVGWNLIEAESLHGFWKWFLNLPVVPWLDLQTYAVLGGAVLGAGLGIILFFPVRQLVVAYRHFLHDRVSKNKFFKWLTNFWFIKVLRFIFIGTGVQA